jgi:hypothetical protein
MELKVFKTIKDGDQVVVTYNVNGDTITDTYTFVTYDEVGGSIVVRLKELALFIAVEEIQNIKVIGGDEHEC